MKKEMMLGTLAFGLLLAVCGKAYPQSGGAAAPQSDFSVGLTDDSTGVVIKKYIGNGGRVIIPATIEGMPVREIAESAFYNCKSLVSVTIPEGVTTIGKGAFSDCYNLTSVTV